MGTVKRACRVVLALAWAKKGSLLNHPSLGHRQAISCPPGVRSAGLGRAPRGCLSATVLTSNVLLAVRCLYPQPRERGGSAANVGAESGGPSPPWGRVGGKRMLPPRPLARDRRSRPARLAPGCHLGGPAVARLSRSSPWDGFATTPPVRPNGQDAPATPPRSSVRQ
jgi:hypothetical protein